MAKKKTSLMIDEALWQEVKINCIKNKKDISDWLEGLIRKELKKEVQKMPTKKGRFEEFVKICMKTQPKDYKNWASLYRTLNENQIKIVRNKRGKIINIKLF